MHCCCFWRLTLYVITFNIITDCLFGFLLVFRESVSTYTRVFSIYISPLSSKPSKHILILLNSNPVVFKG